MLKYILLVFMLAFIFYKRDNSNAKLIFKSSFEDGVYIGKAETRDSTVWWQDIKGSDNSNFSWPIELQGEKGTIQIIVDSSKNLHKYIKNSIEKLNSIDGKTTKALHQIVKIKEQEATQIPYVIYTKDKEQSSLYIRYSLKFPENLSKLLGADGWLTFSEYKTASDYRLAYYIYSDKSGKLYWYVHGDNDVLSDRPYIEYWYQENRKIAVPQGKWFDIELFWKRDSGKKGRVWWAVNGKVITDYHGATKLKEPIHEIMLFSNYANSPIEQWIDNIEIWTNFPCGVGKSCFNKNRR